MTRKTFFKTILGAVGGISVLGQIDKPKTGFIRFPSEKELLRNKAELIAMVRRLRQSPLPKDPDWLNSYHKGVQIAKDEAKQGDYTQITVAKHPYEEVKPYKITHIFPDGRTIKTEFDSSHWQSRASV